jgi:hypothetical protein
MPKGVVYVVVLKQWQLEASKKLGHMLKLAK